MVRINRYLAQCNLGSRRNVEKLILNGKISVNGLITKNLSTQIDPENDIIMYNNKNIKAYSEKIYLMLNKPKKYLVSKHDDFDRKTAYNLLPDFGVHLFSIGRLDYMSSGLLLFTNDGVFSEKLIHPRFKLPKVYKVKVKGSLNKEQINKLRNGIIIYGKKTLPAIVHVKNKLEYSTILKITLFEGRKRQIRYMIKEIGSEVLELKRLQIGNLKLGKLPVGMWRMLKPSEINSLFNYNAAKKGKK
ncbi:MAG: rRNA pseudouridine synthase [Candidatus Cloacimonetes bacterium]|nr:rRNA pseudouridine synthase [Candidatus Cloacimonadota bacterium]